MANMSLDADVRDLEVRVTGLERQANGPSANGSWVTADFHNRKVAGLEAEVKNLETSRDRWKSGAEELEDQVADLTNRAEARGALQGTDHYRSLAEGLAAKLEKSKEQIRLTENLLVQSQRQYNESELDADRQCQRADYAEIRVADLESNIEGLRAELASYPSDWVAVGCYDAVVREREEALQEADQLRAEVDEQRQRIDHYRAVADQYKASAETRWKHIMAKQAKLARWERVLDDLRSAVDVLGEGNEHFINTNLIREILANA